MDGDIPTSIMFLNTFACVSEKNRKQKEDEIKALQTDLAICQLKAEGSMTYYYEKSEFFLYRDVTCDANAKTRHSYPQKNTFI